MKVGRNVERKVGRKAGRKPNRQTSQNQTDKSKQTGRTEDRQIYLSKPDLYAKPCTQRSKKYDKKLKYSPH